MLYGRLFPERVHQQTANKKEEQQNDNKSNFSDFIEPITMYQDAGAPAVKVRGKWYEEAA
jgi:hypothetical protein